MWHPGEGLRAAPVPGRASSITHCHPGDNDAVCSPALPKFLGKDSAVPLRQDSLRAPVLLLPMQRAQLGVGTARAQKIWLWTWLSVPCRSPWPQRCQVLAEPQPADDPAHQHLRCCLLIQLSPFWNGRCLKQQQKREHGAARLSLLRGTLNEL